MDHACAGSAVCRRVFIFSLNAWRLSARLVRMILCLWNVFVIISARGEIKSAINYCRITNTPSARMIEKGITRMGRPVADVQAAIENSGNIEVAKLENGLPYRCDYFRRCSDDWFLRNCNRYGAALFGKWPMPEIILISHCFQEVFMKR